MMVFSWSLAVFFLNVLSISDVILLQMPFADAWHMFPQCFTAVFSPQEPPFPWHKALTGLLRQCLSLLTVIDSLNTGEYGFN